MRCGAGLDVALASIDSVTELHNESESESKVATSSGGANLTDAEGNASREVFAEGLASGFFCAAESQQCSWWRPCCGSLQCESLLGGSGHVCVDKQPQCVSENGICGGPGQLTQHCCGEMQCRQLLGGSQMRCQGSQPQCVARSGICGGPGQLTQPCCGNMQCKGLLGGSDMKCFP
mmetsp:Transcript_14695/g.36543  ORF Transcript_14695/g.36543 Transcript_14695/m.36543 type:complete len:176 (-) Transcript_14695:426-953(-)